MNDMEIKICEERDIDALEEAIPSPGKSQFHRERFEEQKAGKGNYLIAWEDNKIVGHLNFLYQSPEKSEYLKGCPEIRALHVIPEYQSQGIGTKLIRYAEELAKEKGFDKVCIGVAVDNNRARELYERLGYKDWDHGPITSSWDEVDDEGNKQTKTEKAVYLIKRF